MVNLQKLKKIAATIIIVLVLILGTVAYTVFRAPAEASRPIEAIPLAESDGGSSNGSASSQPAPTAATTATPSSPIVMQIVREESEARFIIDEVLNGAPKTVVGTTDQVAGEIAIDPQDPTKTRVGIIQVNARTLTTDSEFRNRALKNEILNTGQYEFITFRPTKIVGLPQNGAVGESYTFQIVGDLTIRDVTRDVTFDVTVTPTAETRLEGTATTTIRYADYGITIPQVRQVASVAEEVRLEIDFVAAAT
jgi:polyisoprenoid-binding protein YceI